MFQKTELAGDVLSADLRQAGLRVTRPRLAVLEVLSEARAACEHLSASQVAERARGQLESLSTQAVYDCLDALTTAGLLRRIQPAGSAARYESRVADNHHHLVCRRCGVVRDVDCIVGRAPCLEPSDASGFVVDEAEIVFWGLCPRCSADQSPPDQGSTGQGSTDQSSADFGQHRGTTPATKEKQLP